MLYRIGHIQEKILLILLGGVALGMCRSSVQYYRLLKALHKGWKEIDQKNFNRSVANLRKRKLLEEKILPDGSFTLMLTQGGKQCAETQNIIGSCVRLKKEKKWDGKWRIVVFDIPEEEKIFRNIFRSHLKALHFLRMQDSVFISPHPYEDALSKLVDVYGSSKYVRIIIAIKIDNEEKLKKFFFGKKLKGGK